MTAAARCESLDEMAEAIDREQRFDRLHALERLYALVHRLRPIDRQVMLLYLEEEDAASIAVQQWRRVGGLMVALLTAKGGWEIWRDTDMVERAGDALIFAALIYLVIRFIRRARATTSPATHQLSRPLPASTRASA